MSIPIICTACAATSSVNKVTAGLRCACGGTPDVYLGTDDQLRAVAARNGEGFYAWMAREAAQASEDQRNGEGGPGSNEYAGPMPGPSQMSNDEGEITCPVCLGSGFDIQDKTQPCRECGGDGKVTPTTTPEDRWKSTYKHQYPSTQTKVPFMGTRRSAKALGKQREASANYGRETKRAEMIQTVARTNPGLARIPGAVERVVDATLRRYPEVR